MTDEEKLALIEGVYAYAKSRTLLNYRKAIEALQSVFGAVRAEACMRAIFSISALYGPETAAKSILTILGVSTNNETDGTR